MSLHVTRTGTGPVLVLLHGSGVSSWMWDDLVAALSDGFHCVAVDLPGSGASHAEPWTSFAATADAIAGVIDDMADDVADDGTAHVVGLSLGGYVTLALLAAHPDRVRSAVVSGITTRPLAPGWLYRPLTRLSVRMMRRRAFVRASARAMRIPAEATAAMLVDAARMSRDAADRIYAELVDGYRTPDLGPAAGRLLAVAGDAELRPVRDGLADLAAAGATAAVAPNAHHAWSAEHPDLFARMVADWALHRTLPPELVPVGATARR